MKVPTVKIEDISRVLVAEEVGLINLETTMHQKTVGIIRIYEELLKKDELTFEEMLLKSSIKIILNGNKDDEYNMYSRSLEVYKILTQ